jgi:hypothetical protein
VPFVYGLLVGFAIVAGWSIVRWRMRGRDPVYADDDSILLGEPPEGLTPAVASLIAGLPPATAFSAALFDLASRGEISFRDETPTSSKPHKIGIEVHAAAQHADDPAIARNRRRPIGQGEAWLLNSLRNQAGDAFAALGFSSSQRTVIDTMVTVMSLAHAAQHPSSAAAPAASAPKAVATSVKMAVDLATSKHGPEAAALLNGAIANPDGVLADPSGFADQVATATGSRPHPDEVAAMATMLRDRQSTGDDDDEDEAEPEADDANAPEADKAGPEADKLGAEAPDAAVSPAGAETPEAPHPAAKSAASAHPSASGPKVARPGKDVYIKASAAKRLQPPRGFVTLLENYARERGWVNELSVAARWRWRGLAIAEFSGGLLLQVIGTGTDAVPIIGFGLGVMLGGIATWFIAPSMSSRTAEGALVRAEVAAYRRTLGGVINSSATLSDALNGSPLRWLNTPDQVIVWGVALWLQPEILALLTRTQAAGASPDANSPSAAMNSPLVFAGLENIGSVSPDQLAMLGPVGTWITSKE